MAGIRYGWSRLGGLRGARRKQLCIRESHSPLGLTLRGRTDYATTTRQSEGQDAHKTCYDYDWRIQHGLLEPRYCGEGAEELWKSCGRAAAPKPRYGANLNPESPKIDFCSLLCAFQTTETHCYIVEGKQNP